MAQITYRANLSAKTFPFLGKNWGRSIIVPQYDSSGNQRLVSSEDTDKDVGVPQFYFCHNVMPHQQGLQSVGYKRVVLGSTTIGDFVDIFLVRDDAGNSTYLAVRSGGQLYRYSAGSWIYVQTLANSSLTAAYVSGVTYLYVYKSGCYKYDFSTNTLTSVTLTSLDPLLVVGITYSAGYLIAWTESTVAWSSTIDATDFTPSLTTGAGSGSIEAARGIIIACVAHLQGFIAYTSNNAVAAIYSGNSRYPFNFREIVASGGILTKYNVSLDANTGNHFVYTTSGLQTISTTQTQTVFPEVTDFISGAVLEDFDPVTKTVYQVTANATLNKQITMVSDRYLVISYGQSSFTHALVYDSAMKRWGKLKIPHVQCFEYALPSYILTEIPRQSIAFLSASGEVVTVDFSPEAVSVDSVLILGKFQFVRSHTLQLDEICLEDVPQSKPFTLSLASSYNGKTPRITTPYLAESDDLFRRYLSAEVGINHSLILEGSFTLVSAVLTFHIHGKP